MRVSACMGNYSEIPYNVPGLEINVYCVEELCYCIRENAFLLDLSLMNDGLLKWLEQQCGLRELVKQLYPLVHRKGSLSAFVVTLLQYVGLYEEAVVREVEQVLKKGAGLSSIERRKSQIDYLVKKKKYIPALKGYDGLIKKWEEQENQGEVMPAVSCLAAIWHNKGVVYAGMMLYERAAWCFRRACELSEDDDYKAAFLAAKRMALSEEKYVALASNYGEMYQQTLELEKKLDQLIPEWEQQPEYLMLYNRRELRSSGNWQKYHQDNDRQTLSLMDSYRSSVME